MSILYPESLTEKTRLVLICDCGGQLVCVGATTNSEKCFIHACEHCGNYENHEKKFPSTIYKIKKLDMEPKP